MAISDKRVSFHIARQQKLKNNRANWNSMWQDLSDYFCPGRITAVRKEVEGARKSKKI